MPAEHVLKNRQIPSRRGILNAELFSWMPQGASVVNAARGGHLVDEDLLAALDSGHVSCLCAGFCLIPASGGHLLDEDLPAALDSGHVS